MNKNTAIALSVLVAQFETTGEPRYGMLDDQRVEIEALLDGGYVEGVPVHNLHAIRAEMEIDELNHAAGEFALRFLGQSEADLCDIDGETWLIGYIPTPKGIDYNDADQSVVSVLIRGMSGALLPILRVSNRSDT